MKSSDGRCQLCGERSFMPYRCRYCGNNFCPSHRLPENHRCEGLKSMREGPGWGDYAAEVQRREAAPRRTVDRWDREEERGRSRLFGGKTGWGIGPWSSTSESESMRRYLVTLLVLSLVLALIIRLTT